VSRQSLHLGGRRRIRRCGGRSTIWRHGRARWICGLRIFRKPRAEDDAKSEPKRIGCTGESRLMANVLDVRLDSHPFAEFGLVADFE
jgi:hypothetical protein